MVTQSKKHTPINFDPQNYEIIAWFDNSPLSGLTRGQMEVEMGVSRAAVDEMFESHAARKAELFPDGQDHHHCQHCGQSIRYVAVGKDKRDGKNIPFGEICAANRLSLPDRASFEREFIHTEANRLKKEYKKQAERAKAREKFCQEYPEFIEAYDKAKDLGLNGFIGSIIEQFEANGKLSAKQVDAVEKAIENHSQREAQKHEDAKSSKWIGEIGERLEFTATIEKIIFGEGYYGEWALTIMKDTGGNVVTYFNQITNKESDQYISKGDTVTFKGTIKGHNEREGVKQTQIQRAGKGVVINSGSDEKSESESDDESDSRQFNQGERIHLTATVIQKAEKRVILKDIDGRQFYYKYDTLLWDSNGVGFSDVDMGDKVDCWATFVEYRSIAGIDYAIVQCAAPKIPFGSIIAVNHDVPY